MNLLRTLKWFWTLKYTYTIIYITHVIQKKRILRELIFPRDYCVCPTNLFFRATHIIDFYPEKNFTAFPIKKKLLTCTYNCTMYSTVTHLFDPATNYFIYSLLFFIEIVWITSLCIYAEQYFKLEEYFIFIIDHFYFINTQYSTYFDFICSDYN